MTDGAHLTVEQLVPEGVERLTPAQRAHLDGCARCRVEARVLAAAWDGGGGQPETVPEVGLALGRSARTALELSRLATTSEGTYVEVDSGGATARLERLRFLGTGPAGAVFEVRAAATGRRHALKLLRCAEAEALERYRRYAERLAAIRHPNLARVHAVEMGRYPGRVVTSLLTDANVLALGVGGPAGGRAPVELNWRALRTGLGQMVVGLSALHDAGLTHGNLKPTNALLDRRGRIVLVDAGQAALGLAEATAGGGLGREQVEERGSRAAGRFVAPEVREGRPPAPTSDWYALGALLSELLGGEARGDGAGAEAGGAVAASEWGQRLAKLGRELQAANPDERPAATDVLEALGLDVADLEADTRLSCAPPPSRAPSGRATPPVPEAPPAQIGPYPVEGVLGRGGMGVVYRCRDPQRGTALAVKTVRSARRQLLDSVRREIAVLARLAHPGLVRVVDHGVAQGLPWYAMPHLAGVTLAQWEPAVRWRASLRAAGGDRAALDELLRLARSLCEALAHLHAAGLVHRDLKPSNVIVQASGQPVIVDFGLASSFAGAIGRDVLEASPALAGTLPYMAPEQIRGDLLDARADLYSLGCILYELIAGHPPFQAASSVELLFKHLHEAVPWPAHAFGGLGGTVRPLLERLLEKRASDRTGYADDVARAVSDALGDEGAGRAAPPYLYRPQLAGRRVPLRRLDEVGRELQAGSGAVVLIQGESGVGKTRLALEWLRSMAHRGCEVLVGSCLPPETGGQGPLGPLRPTLQAIADRCRSGGAAHTSELLGAEGPILAPFEASLAGVPGFDQLEPPAPLPIPETRERLLRSLTRTLSRYAHQRPVLVALDDLQWADGLTLGWLGQLARTAPAQRGAVVAVGLFRSDERRSALVELSEAPEVVALELQRLDEAAVREMIASMLGARPGAGAPLGAFVAEHAGGNPFFVAEYLRLAVSEGALVRDGRGGWELAGARASKDERLRALPMPTSVRDVLGRRLEKLGAAQRALAEALAVLGRPADPRELVPLVGEVAPEQTQSLVQGALLEAPDRGGVRFAHVQMAELTYEQIEPERRRLLHLKAARSLTAAQQSGAPTAAVLAETARHWRRGGRREEAAATYLAAARAAARQFDHEGGAQGYEAYLALLEGPSAEGVRARLELAQLRLDAGAHAAAAAAATQAIAEASSLGLATAAVEGRLVAAEAQRILGDRAVARALLEAAAREIEPSSQRSLEGRRLSSLATVLADDGDTGAAVRLLERALALQRASGDRLEEGVTLNRLANLLQLRGELDRARATLATALAIHRAEGNRRSEGITLHALGLALQAQGRLEEARGCFTAALGIERAVGDRRFEGLTLTGLAVGHVEGGDLATAELLLEQAVAIHRETGGRWARAVARTHLGMVRLRDGRLEEADALLEEALAAHRELGNQLYLAYAQIARATLHRTRGELDGAATCLVEADEALHAVESPFGRVLWLCERGRLAVLEGADAEPFWTEAQRLARRLGVGRDAAGELARALRGLQQELASGG